MNVTAWRNGDPGNVSAHGVIVRGAVQPPPAPPAFEQVAAAALEPDAPGVNAAPLISPVDGTAYIFATGRYRASPVFLARAAADAAAVADPAQWRWLAATSAPPAWGAPGDRAAAAPLALGGGPVGAGELSALYHATAQRFVLCFFNFSASRALPSLLCQAGAQPWGPWSQPQTVVDGSEPWFPQGAGGPYGGYVVETPLAQQGAAAAGAIEVTALLSLWVPYRVFAFATSFAELF
jgi:hypothetical protein